jgi:hypothetical protein
VCSLLSLISYPKRVHFASLTLATKYWGVRTTHAPEQDHNHNHNLDIVALNYPCPVSRQRIVRHNGTKHRKNETHERSYFYLCYPCWSHHTCGSCMETGPPSAPGGSTSTFAMLMVGAPGSPTPTPPGGPPSTFLSVVGGRSRISVSILPGARCRYFLALVVGTPRSPTLTPHREHAVDICYVDGRCFWISVSTSQGAHR